MNEAHLITDAILKVGNNIEFVLYIWLIAWIFK